MPFLFAALRRHRPDLDPARLARTRALMATRCGTGRSTASSLDLDDRHVLPAAIRAKAQVIVTANVRDFPVDELKRWDVDRKSPDEFVRDQISLDRSAIYAAVQQIADSWKNPPGSIEDVLDRLERSGLAISVAELRARP